ncbi:MAG: hypothetical protein IJ599_02625 [Alphaproteobacteria bacterium]|nr:hypothetical protein [Alphaproteobacteria bacterium]MBR1479768.1 hypothetical protein [Alphaproteobacteria bacterium]
MVWRIVMDFKFVLLAAGFVGGAFASQPAVMENIETPQQVSTSKEEGGTVEKVVEVAQPQGGNSLEQQIQELIASNKQVINSLTKLHSEALETIAKINRLAMVEMQQKVDSLIHTFADAYTWMTLPNGKRIMIAKQEVQDLRDFDEKKFAEANESAKKAE